MARTDPTKALRLAARTFRREWRAGELRVLLAALVIAVGSVTAVSFFTDRVDRGMSFQASELLAADLLIRSRYPIADRIAVAARAAGLATARTLGFHSVLVAGERFQLAEVKAVTPGYPLRGRLQIAPTPFAAGRETDTIPAPGEVWLDSRLMSLLELSVGDAVELGAATFRVGQVLSYEPDRGGNLFSIGPRIMLNQADIPATELVQPASRVSYRLLLAGDAAEVAAFRDRMEPTLGPDARFQGVRDARPELRAALDRAKQFLGLASLVSVLLAGVAIAVSAQRYAARHLDSAAVLRCFGATQALVMQMYLWQLGFIGLAGGLAGGAIGFLGQEVLAALLAAFLVDALPAPAWPPMILGLGFGLVTLVGFAVPPLLRLKRVPPARVLRRELGGAPTGSVTVYACALVALAVLVYWQADDAVLTSYVLGGGIASVALLAAAAFGLVQGLGLLRRRVGVAWRFGLANISRRGTGTLIQVVAFGLGMMALLLLTFVRADLLREWQRRLPPDAPNFFLINIQPGEVSEVRAYLRREGLPTAALYPMIRGRLIRINDRRVSADDYTEPRARRLATREFNLSFAARPPPANRIVAGAWWPAAAPGRAEFSVEQGIAETLGLALGDDLTFQVAGQPVRGVVSSLRAVDWDSFEVNFFVVAPPALLEGYPATYISSFYLPAGRRGVLTGLIRAFPSVTVLDVDALMSKVRALMDQAARGVEYVFAFTLLAGLCVLYAAIQTTLDERRYESAIVRTLGGDRRRVRLGLAAEFLTLGLLAGVLASVAATAVGAVLATQVFELGYRPDPWIWLVGIPAGTLGVGIAGMLGTRSVLDRPPLETLRAL